MEGKRLISLSASELAIIALMTKAHLSGHATLGDFNLLAVGSSILQGKGMGNGNTLGPHACLMNKVGDGQTYLGSPALAVK